jgi:glycosyltransferase involved in cell wall biosynthesis
MSLIKKPPSETVLNTRESGNEKRIEEEALKINPFVSVIVAVFNKAPYLRETLNCIINQTLRNIEIVLVDDGSTDGSYIILNEFAKIDKRIILIQQENAGPGPARNAGLKVSRGDYLAILDADDTFELNMLEEMYRKAEREGCDIVVCNFQCLDNLTGKIIPGEYGINYRDIHHCETYNPQALAKYIFQLHVSWTWDKLFKRDLALKYSCIFPPLHGPEDVFFVFSLLLMAKRVSIVDKIFVTYRINDYSSVINTRSKSVYDYAKAIELVKDFMVKYNIYKLYEQSFINWSLNCCIWNMNFYIERHDINEILADSFREVFDYNKTVFFDKLGLDKYSDDYFYNNAEYQEYRNITSMPFQYYALRRLAAQRERNLFLEACIRSRSWRIGRAITWMPRKVRGFFRCLNQHGWKWALRLFLKKCQSKDIRSK